MAGARPSTIATVLFTAHALLGLDTGAAALAFLRLGAGTRNSCFTATIGCGTCGECAADAFAGDGVLALLGNDTDL